MPSQKRRTQSSKKQFIGKQMMMAQRSRSIKASLLKSLSIDLAALYYLNSQREDRNRATREASTTNPANLESQRFTIENQLEKSEEQCSQSPSKIEAAVPNNENKQLPPSAIPQLERQDKPQSAIPQLERQDKPQAATVTLLIARCLAFLIGLLTHYVISWFFPQSLILLSGVAIAISGTSILAAVTLAPWNRKLLWNLCSLFGGLLFAVFVL
ncbi:hypothetical protein ACQ4M3_06265 [Leptolyngbya sp. AN03gr2]|uniref:hypothetical protein n=1 Tax=unclassified Leptolyngbya TaxID=2650499 RepID=UPI003D314D78